MNFQFDTSILSPNVIFPKPRLDPFLNLTIDEKAVWHTSNVNLIQTDQDATNLAASTFPMLAWSKNEIADVAYLALYGETTIIKQTCQTLYDSYMAASLS